MKKLFKAAAVILGVASFGALAACNHGSFSHDPKKLKGHIESKLKSLGASDEQRAKIGGITDRMIADCGEIHKNSKGLRQQVVGCLLLDNPDREWLHRTVDEKAKELAAFAHRTVDSLIEISGTLTHEQRAELKKRLETGHGKGK